MLDNLWNKARRRSGLARFERECKCTVMLGRKRKAFAVPGTREAGERNMLAIRTREIYEELLSEQKDSTQ